MKVDYKRFPDIPKGCSLNYNKKSDLYQVYRALRVENPLTNKKEPKREHVGSIRNGVFKFSETYLYRNRIAELEKENNELKSLVQTLPSENHRVAEAAQKVSDRVSSMIKDSKLDSCLGIRSEIAFESIALPALMCSLTGDTDANIIADYPRVHAEFFERYMPSVKSDALSHDTVRANLLMAKPERFEQFYLSATSQLIEKTWGRVIAGDGQAVRATGRRKRDDQTLRGARMLMSFYDTKNQVCLSQRLIDEKTNEITVGPKMLENLDISGCIVTADAMSCQLNFVEAVLRGNADYVLSLKGNQDKCWQEVHNIFASADETLIDRYVSEVTLAHGRIEQRTIEALPGRFLSSTLTDKWQGLADGIVVRTRTQITNKATDTDSDGFLYYISSLPFAQGCAKHVAYAIREHWAIENRLHYMLDVFWKQDRMQSSNAAYITNRAALNKLALAFLQHYAYWLWNTNRTPGDKPLSIHQLQTRCRKPEVAVECLAVGLGFVR